jgi:hypothetical protein
MDTSVPRIVCALFLTGTLWACGSGATSPPDQATPTAAAAGVTDTQPSSSTHLSPASSSSPEPQENPPPSASSPPADNPTLPPNVRPALCNDSLFLEDVTIPDGTIVAPGTQFVKTWKFRNTGTCSWTTSYAIGFAYGDAMHGIDTALPNAVNSGGTVDVAVNMTAPQANGWYGGWWRLRNGSGDYFGDFVYVSILVSDGSETSTPGS